MMNDENFFFFFFKLQTNNFCSVVQFSWGADLYTQLIKFLRPYELYYYYLLFFHYLQHLARGCGHYQMKSTLKKTGK